MGDGCIGYVSAVYEMIPPWLKIAEIMGRRLETL